MSYTGPTRLTVIIYGYRNGGGYYRLRLALRFSTAYLPLWLTTPNHASPPNAPSTTVTGGGNPNHSVNVNAPEARTPHHGSDVSGLVMVVSVDPDADVWMYPTFFFVLNDSS